MGQTAHLSSSPHLEQRDRVRGREDPGNKGQAFPSLCSRLVLKVLSLARRQYSLLQAANLLTPDMIAEFETLQQLVREEEPGPGAEASGTPGPAREAPPAQELCSESSESRPCSASASWCRLQSQPVPRGSWGVRSWERTSGITGCAERPQEPWQS